LRLEYEGAVSPRGGNLLEILISPEEVKDGTVTRFVTLDAVKSGNFKMKANIETSSKGSM
jgi:hypothetical protein